MRERGGRDDDPHHDHHGAPVGVAAAAALVGRLEVSRQLYTPLRLRWAQGDHAVSPSERWAPLLAAVGGPKAWETLARGLSTLEEYELALASAELGVRL